ncbi:hypothetical protein [Streptomyces sp. NPDC021562]|uniref:hypothetical protein n=1 Tax=Streptomyces sp. NPDC021562 TaxID=3155121 RepID=UPI0033F08464
MKDAEILAHFDGRGTAEFSLSGLEAGQSDMITAIGFEFGYDLKQAEAVSRSTMRMIFVRNDSPTARQRAWQTHDRLRAGGPLLATWTVPGAAPGAADSVTAVDMASKRRGLAAYEANGIKGFVVFIAVLSLGCFILAWVLRDSPNTPLAVMAAVLGIAVAVAAALTPRWMKQWYEKNRRLVDLYDQQRSGQVGPPPPPPPPGPTDPHPGSGSGQ